MAKMKAVRFKGKYMALHSERLLSAGGRKPRCPTQGFTEALKALTNCKPLLW